MKNIITSIVTVFQSKGFICCSHIAMMGIIGIVRKPVSYKTVRIIQPCRLHYRNYGVHYRAKKVE